MSRRHFQFYVIDENNELLKRLARDCFSANAPVHAMQLLCGNPEAAAVYAVEQDGPATYSAYRR